MVDVLTSGVSTSASTGEAALQGMAVTGGDLHNAQLVALQNAADSSQPQLVALHSADGTEALQVGCPGNWVCYCFALVIL